MNRSRKKLLIIEAHSDDSSIGISGYLNRFKNQLDFHFVLLACSSIKMLHYGNITVERRLEEYQRFVDHYQGQWHRGEDNKLPFDADSLLDQIPKSQIITILEELIYKIKPDQLIFQGASFHQDHTVVYESVIAATRPSARFCPKEMYIMENPTYVHSVGPYTDFKPNYYIKLSQDEIDEKLKNFKSHFPSQVRDGDNCLSLEGIKSWARYRGLESQCEYAEALMTYKRVK